MQGNCFVQIRDRLIDGFPLSHHWQVCAVGNVAAFFTALNYGLNRVLQPLATSPIYWVQAVNLKLPFPNLR